MSSPSISQSPQPPAAPAALWRRALRFVGWMLAILVALVVLWIGAQFALRRPRPVLLFTQADLPPIPPPVDNAWEVLNNEVAATNEPERPDKDIGAICDGKATFTDRWARAEAHAEQLAKIASDGQTVKWLGVIDKAAALPHYADACPVQFTPKCLRPLSLLAWHQLQEAVVLDAAVHHRWEDAFVRALQMTRMDTQFLPSARSTLNQSVARADVHRSIKLIDTLLDGAAHQKESGQGPDATRLTEFARQIEALLVRVQEKDVDPLKAVIAEYLFAVYAVEHLTEVPNSRFSRFSSILYDQGHTLEMLNGQYEQYVAFARAGGTGPAPVFRRPWGWFLRNPYGHLALGLSRGTLENHVPTIAKDRALLMKDHEALRARLKALTNAP